MEQHFRKIFLILLIATLFILVFNFDSLSNVYANTIHERAFSNYTVKMRFDDQLIAQTKYSPELFDNQLDNYSNHNILRGQKVLMFVMEQTSYRAFVEDSRKIPKERNFFGKVKNNTHIFTNYYTNNQDSMTSVWTMLNSEFLPFESYISNWNKYYGFTLGANNLVELFNFNQYETHAVASAYTSGLILGVYNWTDVTFLNPKRQYGNFFCPQEFEYEPGCEDNVILDDVKGIIKNHKEDGLFLVQEFIYGHGAVYENTLHKTKTEYYNDYFLNLYNFMEQQNLLENTTLIILADHGEKGYFEKELWNYQTPLLIINKNLKYKEINDLYSTMDLKDILLSYLQGTELKPSDNFTFIIGQTQSSEIAYVDKKGGYFLAKLDKSNTLRLKEMKGLGNENIKNLTKILLKYRLDSIEKSNGKNYWCSNCDQNRIKAGL